MEPEGRELVIDAVKRVMADTTAAISLCDDDDNNDVQQPIITHQKSRRDEL